MESAEQEGVPNLPTGGLGEGTGEKVLLDQLRTAAVFRQNMRREGESGLRTKK